jgi:uncharacterized protein (TIGR03437 family)
MSPLCGLLGVPAECQFVQQGPKLAGSGAAGDQLNGYAWLGYSAALSEDGDTALVGGPNDNFTTGAAWVFTRKAGVWAQQGSKLVGAGGVGIGWQALSVALSSDGNTAITGGFADNGAVGAAWVFTRNAGVWTQQGPKLVASGATGNAHQGVSVALSGDGNTALVGGNGDNGFVGAAWVFTRSGGVWTQQGAKLIGGGVAGGANYGISVALSRDGDTALIGGLYDNAGAGAAWVFRRNSGAWTQQGSKLVGTGAAGAANQGVSVALSGDGNTALVGGSKDNSPAGAAWVFTRTGGVWSQQGSKLVASDSGAAGQGTSVALSGDGSIAMMGAPRAGVTGAAWVFTRNAEVWTQLSPALAGSGAIGYALQGQSVALSGDGNTAMVGGSWDDAGTGAAWAFTLLLAQPAAVMNNYSYIKPDQPGYGIAQGSIFVLFGNDMAASSTSLQGVPLKTTLNGVTLNVTVNGTTTHPPLYYVTPSQIAGILPSATPVGAGQLTVTNVTMNRTSAPIAIQVVENAFGLMTLNGAGFGPAAALDVNYRYLGSTNAANPGDYVSLWGSGLGPIAGDETLQAPQDLAGIPIEVFVGGVKAAVAYQGRSIYPGLDQINVVVPPGVQGCNVSVTVLSGSSKVVSNLASIPVAASGRACSDQTTGIASSRLHPLQGRRQ